MDALKNLLNYIKKQNEERYKKYKKVSTDQVKENEQVKRLLNKNKAKLKNL